MHRLLTSVLLSLGLMMPLTTVAQQKATPELERLRADMYRLYSTDSLERFMDVTVRLKEAALKAGDERTFYRAWANQALYTFRKKSRKEGQAILEQQREYAQQHDSKFGIVTAIYAQANMSLKANMEERAVELCKEAIDYKNRYLPDVNCTHIYWMLAKIHLVNKRRKEALDALNKCQQEQFGDDRLLDALRQTQFENPQQVIESLKQEVEVFRTGAEPNDDLTMMCLYVS